MKERLQKLISEAGICSRRTAEKLIDEGKVTINGRIAAIGEKADKNTDIIEVNSKRINFNKRNLYIMLNKPRGYVTTMSDEYGRNTVVDLVKDCGERVYPIGRLDKESEGLLLLTNDGELAHSLMHPKLEIEKTYDVTVHGDVQNIANRLSAVKKIDEEEIIPAKVTLLERMGNNARLEVIIHQGKNRQIRRMCKSVGVSVTKLKRVKEGSLILGDLKIGKWRYLTANEVGILKDQMK